MKKKAKCKHPNLEYDTLANVYERCNDIYYCPKCKKTVYKND